VQIGPSHLIWTPKNPMLLSLHSQCSACEELSVTAQG